MGEGELSDADIEAMAQVIHDDYLALVGEDAGLPAAKPWSALDGEYKGQCRDQARAIPEKLAAIRWRLVRASSEESAEPVEIPDQHVEELARREHDRWMAQKYDQGYRWGPERDPDGRREHPDLKPWEELDPPTQAKDRKPVERIPWVLAAAGYKAVPLDAPPAP